MVSDIDHAISAIKITSEELVEDSDESDYPRNKMMSFNHSQERM
jgi:hypothetical protein